MSSNFVRFQEILNQAFSENFICLAQRSGASFPLYKYFLSQLLPLMATNSTFSIKAHFLIWSYQACNTFHKLVICMPTNTNKITDYGHPERKQPSLHVRKFTPTPKFLDTAKVHFVCQIGPIFQIYLIYAFIGCPQSVNKIKLFNLHKPIKTHFLIWSYQARNSNNCKLVICMATNAIKIKLFNLL